MLNTYSEPDYYVICFYFLEVADKRIFIYRHKDKLTEFINRILVKWGTKEFHFIYYFYIVFVFLQ